MYRVIPPCRKFQGGIHSETIRTTPKSVFEPMQMNPNQFKKSVLSRLLERLKINPTQSD